MKNELEIRAAAGVDVSSIGPQWPPQETSFNRIKGIDNRAVIRDSSRFSEVLEEVKYLREKVINNHQEKIDRISVRLFVQNDTWRKAEGEMEDLGEAIIPLMDTSPDFQNVSILYLGANAPARQSNPDELAQCIKNVNEAMKRPQLSYGHIANKVESKGYRIAILRQSVRQGDTLVINQMADLYRRFGWDRGQVVEILAKKENIVSVVFDGEEIVSAGIAETSLVQFEDGRKFRMAEITEAATREDHQRQGLYSAVAAKLVHELAIGSKKDEFFGGGIDLIFGECNGNETGVLNAVKGQGRTFSYELTKGWSLPFKGYIPQHVPIAGAPKTTDYNDLFPAYMTKRDLARFVKL